MPKSLNNLITLTLFGLLIASFILFWDLRPDYLLKSGNNRSISSETAEADSYMTDIESTSFTKTGALDYLLNARQSLHFKRGNYFVLSAPHLVAYNAEPQNTSGLQITWEMTSSRGTVKNQGNRVVLQENVNLWKPEPAGEETRLVTSELTVLPRRKLANTDKRVKLTNAEGVTTGRGMDANLVAETFALRSEVKGVYVGL